MCAGDAPAIDRAAHSDEGIGRRRAKSRCASHPGLVHRGPQHRAQGTVRIGEKGRSAQARSERYISHQSRNPHPTLTLALIPGARPTEQRRAAVDTASRATSTAPHCHCRPILRRTNRSGSLVPPESWKKLKSGELRWRAHVGLSYDASHAGTHSSGWSRWHRSPSPRPGRPDSTLGLLGLSWPATRGGQNLPYLGRGSSFTVLSDNSAARCVLYRQAISARPRDSAPRQRDTGSHGDMIQG